MKRNTLEEALDKLDRKTFSSQYIDAVKRGRIKHNGKVLTLRDLGIRRLVSSSEGLNKGG